MFLETVRNGWTEIEQFLRGVLFFIGTLREVHNFVLNLKFQDSWMNYLFLYLKENPGKDDKSMALYSVVDFFG